MSSLSISRRTVSTRRLALPALAGALAASLLSGAAMAETAAVAPGKPTMNFVGSFEATSQGVSTGASTGASTLPASSLLSEIRKARAARTVIEPAAAGTTTRALAHDTEIPAEPDGGDEVPESLVAEVNDPFEPVNRVIFGFNEIVDFLVLRPVSKAYRAVVPQPLRTGVANALHNFATPVIFANDLLQGRPDRAKNTAVRFLVNSTAGFGGMVDAASAAGLPRHSEDFGQTLAVWGARPGAYIVLPVFGPSTVRDTVGIGVDTLLHPATWLMSDLDFIERASPVLAYTVSTHEAYLDEAEALRSTSPDFYATARDIYSQRRAADIANGDFAAGGFDDQGDGTAGLSDEAFDALPPIPIE